MRKEEGSSRRRRKGTGVKVGKSTLSPNSPKALTVGQDYNELPWGSLYLGVNSLLQ